MTAVEIATGIIDKLQEENHALLDTLKRAQDKIKYNERQLAEKEQLIKVVEEQQRYETDGLLRMNNKQKEITIRNLNLQIDNLLKEKENLEVRLEAFRSEICPRCETKLLLNETKENKSSTKVHKYPGKASTVTFERKPPQSVCPSRVSSLENIIKHKDKRIENLSKEINRLTKSEKELTQKINRLNKLLPKSGLPADAITDCLLKEIQGLESHISDDKLQDILNKVRQETTQASVYKDYASKSSDRLKKSSASGINIRNASTHRSEQAVFLDSNKVENEVLFRRLQKLCTDVDELKRLFAFESEKLSNGLNSTATEYSLFKIRIQEIIDSLNDVVQNIVGNDFNDHQNALKDTPKSSDDTFIISNLQERLKEALRMLTDCENENKELKESLAKLKAEQCTCKIYRNLEGKSYSDSKQIEDINDVKTLKDIIKKKDNDLEANRLYISNCLRSIGDLRKSSKVHSSFENMGCYSANVEEKERVYEEQKNKLQIKLDAAEKQIRTLEDAFERSQNSAHHLEQENARLESELHKIKSKAITEANNQENIFTKICSCDTANDSLKQLNEELQNKVESLKEANLKFDTNVKELHQKIKNLEESNSKLETNAKLLEIKDITLSAIENEKASLKTKLDASEKHICSLEKSAETLQKKLKTVEIEKGKLEAELRERTIGNKSTEAYENENMLLRSDLFVKDEEIRELKESLRALENKSIEMNEHRRTLHKEIEKLCKILMEDDILEDITRRKAVHKAAVLHSAQSLLNVDKNYNLKPDEIDRNREVEELKNRIDIYLTEVARINELVTLKEKQRDNLLKDYIDIPSGASLRPSPSIHYESRIHGRDNNQDLQSSPNLQPFKSDFSSQKNFNSLQKSPQFDFDTTNLKRLQDELDSTKAVTSYLLSECSRLEDSFTAERTERARCEIELETCHKTVNDLRDQLSKKGDLAKRLNTLIELMRSKEFNDEITLEQLKSEIKWLSNENQKLFDKVTSTQTELSRCREENCRAQNDLESIKRHLLNEKYENAKINNELRNLRSRISGSQFALNEI